MSPKRLAEIEKARGCYGATATGSLIDELLAAARESIKLREALQRLTNERNCGTFVSEITRAALEEIK